MFNMFVVDLLHEVELGVWRSLFVHLLRLLQAVNRSQVQELDLRCVTQRNVFLVRFPLQGILAFGICQHLVSVLFDDSQPIHQK